MTNSAASAADKNQRRSEMERKPSLYQEVEYYMEGSRIVTRVAAFLRDEHFTAEQVLSVLEDAEKRKNLVEFIRAGYPDIEWKRHGGTGLVTVECAKEAKLKFVAKFKLDLDTRVNTEDCFRQFDFHDMRERSAITRLRSGKWDAEKSPSRPAMELTAYQVVPPITYTQAAARLLEMDENTLPQELERRLIKYGHTLTVGQLDALDRQRWYKKDGGFLENGSTVFVEDNGHVFPTKLQFLCKEKDRVWKYPFDYVCGDFHKRLIVAQGLACDL
jgi:hypothetical protein